MTFVLAVNGWYLGGFATFCRNLSLGLRRRGHEVVLLILPHAELEQALPHDGFDKCVVLPRGLCRLTSYIERVAQAINQFRPDILVLNDSAYGMAALPFIHSAILRIPVVHSIAPDEIERGLSQEPWCDRVVAVSEFVKRAVECKAPNRLVSICHLGVPVPEANRKRLSSDERSPIEIISVGRVVVYQKRMDRVPAIARLLAERKIAYHWSILGDGEYLPRLRRTMKRLGLADRFSFPGAVSPPLVMAALQQAEVFVMPSECEGMPQALLEAMAQGVVPAVSRIPGSTTSVVEVRKSGYLCQEAGDFAEAIAELSTNRRLCAQMGSQAAAHIARNFSLEAFSNRFLNIVSEVHTQQVPRPAPLPLSPKALGAQPAVGCLGFWRSLRHHTLGRFKREWIRRWAGLGIGP